MDRFLIQVPRHVPRSKNLIKTSYYYFVPRVLSLFTPPNRNTPRVSSSGPRASQYTQTRPTSRWGRLGTATLQPTPASSHTHFSESERVSRWSSGGIFQQNETQQILKAGNTKTSKLQPENQWDRACRIELDAKLIDKFSTNQTSRP